MSAIGAKQSITSQLYQTESEPIQPTETITVVHTGFIQIYLFRDELAVHYQALSASVVFSYCFSRPMLMTGQYYFFSNSGNSVRSSGNSLSHTSSSECRVTT
ncbi:hypothetical protein ACGAPV_002687 [Morganella morganii]